MKRCLFILALMMNSLSVQAVSLFGKQVPAAFIWVIIALIAVTILLVAMRYFQYANLIAIVIGCTLIGKLAGGAEISGIMGAFIGNAIGLYIAVDMWSTAAVKRQRQELEQELQRERKEAQLQKQAYAESSISFKLNQLLAEAQLIATRLTSLASAIDLSLVQAENELSEGLYSPFWETLESVVQQLVAFETHLQNIAVLQQQYADKAQTVPGAVKFSLGSSVLPDLAISNQRLKTVYRQAQKDPQFAQIYEQRRGYALPVAGFRSLGEAINQLGDKLETELATFIEFYYS